MVLHLPLGLALLPFLTTDASAPGMCPWLLPGHQRSLLGSLCPLSVPWPLRPLPPWLGRLRGEWSPAKAGQTPQTQTREDREDQGPLGRSTDTLGSGGREVSWVGHRLALGIESLAQLG